MTLGIVAVTSCGDNKPGAPDARPPADARPPVDARPPADAPPPIDGSVPAVDSGTDAALMACDPAMDSLEPNDTLATAALVQPSSIVNDPSDVHGSWEVNACLGQGNEDWYLIEVSQLDFAADPEFDGAAILRVRAIMDGTGTCRSTPECGIPTPPAAPENTVIVDVYAADTMELLSTRQNTQGLAQFTGLSDAYDQDLLVRVSGPAQALYGYQLLVFVEVEAQPEVCEC